MKHLKDIIEERNSDIEALSNAIDYGQSLIFNGSADSSMRRRKRMDWVKKAESEYLEEHKKDILELAKRMCQESISLEE